MSLVLPRPSLSPALRRRSAAPDVRRWRDGPTPVSLADLAALTRGIAEEVAQGRHTARVDTAERWSERLHADALLDVWLIGWAPTQAAELHDHGGSIGALTVVSGDLTEWRWSAGRADADDPDVPDAPAVPAADRLVPDRSLPDRFVTPEEAATHGPGLRRRVLAAGRGASFPLGHVHDVSNRGTAAAVSVHAYSPPLSAMSYYDVDGGTLRRTRSELVAPGASPE